VDEVDGADRDGVDGEVELVATGGPLEGCGTLASRTVSEVAAGSVRWSDASIETRMP
jgi:hypothetical protein